MLRNSLTPRLVVFLPELWGRSAPEADRAGKAVERPRTEPPIGRLRTLRGVGQARHTARDTAAQAGQVHNGRPPRLTVVRRFKVPHSPTTAKEARTRRGA